MRILDRMLSWICVMAAAALMVVSTIAAIDYFFKFAPAEAGFRLVNYPFQYGFDRCRARLAVLPFRVLVVGEQEAGVIAYDDFKASHPDSSATYSHEVVSSTMASVVYDRRGEGAPGYAWIQTADGACPGNVYAVHVFTRNGIF